MPSKNPCSLTFFVVAVIATFAWVFYVCALSTPGDFVFGLPLPPKEDDKQGLFKVPRKDMPGVGGDSSDMGWLVAKYQALASKPTKSSSVVQEPQQTVHAEMGLTSIYGHATNLDGGVGKQFNSKGYRTWPEICDEIELWGGAGGAAFKVSAFLDLCGEKRGSIYRLWGYATLLSLTTAAISWFICLCPQRWFRRVGGALSLLGAVLGLAALLQWQSAVAQFETAIGGCAGVLGVGTAVAQPKYDVAGAAAVALCTNWTMVMGVGGGPALAASGACSNATNATFWKLPMSAGAAANNAFSCGKGTALMLGGLAIGFSVLQALLFCLVSGEERDNLESDSDDDDEQRDAKRVARAKRSAENEGSGVTKGAASAMEFQDTSPTARGDDGGGGGGGGGRKARKKQANASDPLSAGYELPQIGHASSVRNPISSTEAEITHM